MFSYNRYPGATPGFGPVQQQAPHLQQQQQLQQQQHTMYGGPAPFGTGVSSGSFSTMPMSHFGPPGLPTTAANTSLSQSFTATRNTYAGPPAAPSANGSGFSTHRSNAGLNYPSYAAAKSFPLSSSLAPELTSSHQPLYSAVSGASTGYAATTSTPQPQNNPAARPYPEDSKAPAPDTLDKERGGRRGNRHRRGYVDNRDDGRALRQQGQAYKKHGARRDHHRHRHDPPTDGSVSTRAPSPATTAKPGELSLNGSMAANDFIVGAVSSTSEVKGQDGGDGRRHRRRRHGEGVHRGSDTVSPPVGREPLADGGAKLSHRRRRRHRGKGHGHHDTPRSGDVSPQHRCSERSCCGLTPPRGVHGHRDDVRHRHSNHQSDQSTSLLANQQQGQSTFSATISTSSAPLLVPLPLTPAIPPPPSLAPPTSAAGIPTVTLPTPAVTKSVPLTPNAPVLTTPLVLETGKKKATDVVLASTSRRHRRHRQRRGNRRAHSSSSSAASRSDTSGSAASSDTSSTSSPRTSRSASSSRRDRRRRHRRSEARNHRKARRTSKSTVSSSSSRRVSGSTNRASAPSTSALPTNASAVGMEAAKKKKSGGGGILKIFRRNKSRETPEGEVTSATGNEVESARSSATGTMALIMPSKALYDITQSASDSFSKKEDYSSSPSSARASRQEQSRVRSPPRGVVDGHTTQQGNASSNISIDSSAAHASNLSHPSSKTKGFFGALFHKKKENNGARSTPSPDDSSHMNTSSRHAASSNVGASPGSPVPVPAFPNTHLSVPLASAPHVPQSSGTSTGTSPGSGPVAVGPPPLNKSTFFSRFMKKKVNKSAIAPPQQVPGLPRTAQGDASPSRSASSKERRRDHSRGGSRSSPWEESRGRPSPSDNRGRHHSRHRATGNRDSRPRHHSRHRSVSAESDSYSYSSSESSSSDSGSTPARHSRRGNHSRSHNKAIAAQEGEI